MPGYRFFIYMLSARRVFGVAFLLLVYIHTSAQNRYNKAIQLISDNDSYTLRGKDGYYTNGLKIAFYWKDKNDTSFGTIHSLEIGQLMYNAKNGSYNEIYELDRPVTAFLYGAYRQTHFSKKNNVFQWYISLGTIGPPAFGRQMQEAIHSTLHMYKPQEWNFQLKSEFGVNVHAQWSAALLNAVSSSFDIKPVIGATLGNTFTNANIGAAMLLGKFNSNAASVFWNALPNARRTESFFYLYPQVIFKGYDATVQGGMFRHNKGSYVGVLNRVVFLPRLGWMYARHRFSLDLALSYESRESLTQQEAQWFGTIGLGYSF